MEATSSDSPTSGYIHLNVGGVVYTTSLKTLTRYKDSMLGEMFLQDQIPSAKDKHGRFMIDRDGTLFRYILNFLRDDGALNLPRDPSEYDQLLTEARFYGLDELVKRMSIHLNVNGVHYMTTKSILTRFVGSSLRELFSKDPIPLERDREGRYILEGDGDLFQYILNFLEDDDLHLPARFEKFTKLDKEAQRYKLGAISKALKVRLIVGGQEFSSPRADLINVKGSLLEEIFTQTPIHLERDDFGRYIIQRNAKIFECILNYLKNWQWNLTGCSSSSYRDIQAEGDYFKLEALTPQLKCVVRVDYRVQQHDRFQTHEHTTAWKYLTKYKGSILEEKFADARGDSRARNVPLYHLDVAYRDMDYVIKFLETGDVSHAPQAAYPKILAIAIHLRLGELQRLLNE